MSSAGCVKSGDNPPAFWPVVRSPEIFWQNTCNSPNCVIQRRHFEGLTDASCSVHQSKRSLAIKSLLALTSKLMVRTLLRACKFSAGGSLILRQTKQLHLDAKPSASAFEAVQGGSDPSCGERFGCASVISPKTNQQTLCFAHHLGFAVVAWRFFIDQFFGSFE